MPVPIATHRRQNVPWSFKFMNETPGLNKEERIQDILLHLGRGLYWLSTLSYLKPKKREESKAVVKTFCSLVTSTNALLLVAEKRSRSCFTLLRVHSLTYILESRAPRSLHCHRFPKPVWPQHALACSWHQALSMGNVYTIVR